ncbi:hypothetical protein VP01_1392g1 [Puccinia sorghi]|uniref:Uncharacterized protein n=1 Tax=Puccinia sorghi TaxID=27349 RepID=A0A0L6VL52_9BASI|nr:hypothetical protein VP01_1392g1 [Puccinia sorghi]
MHASRRFFFLQRTSNHFFALHVVCAFTFFLFSCPGRYKIQLMSYRTEDPDKTEEQSQYPLCSGPSVWQECTAHVFGVFEEYVIVFSLGEDHKDNLMASNKFLFKLYTGSQACVYHAAETGADIFLEAPSLHLQGLYLGPSSPFPQCGKYGVPCLCVDPDLTEIGFGLGQAEQIVMLLEPDVSLIKHGLFPFLSPSFTKPGSCLPCAPQTLFLMSHYIKNNKNKRVHHCTKNLLNCLQLTCRKSQEASVVTPTILQKWFNQALMHSHCADCRVTVPKHLHLQTFEQVFFPVHSLLHSVIPLNDAGFFLSQICVTLLRIFLAILAVRITLSLVTVTVHKDKRNYPNISSINRILKNLSLGATEHMLTTKLTNVRLARWFVRVTQNTGPVKDFGQAQLGIESTNEVDVLKELFMVDVNDQGFYLDKIANWGIYKGAEAGDDSPVG